MKKPVKITQTIYELNEMYPEFKEAMIEAGFEKIANPKMMATVGRFMTIEKGATMKDISLETIKEVFESKGFALINEEGDVL
ncbi:MAG TPA: hypothetical protein DHN33_05640 [Eubacteriaceae bacterium]|nr:hypothetical protein [Eubacteriaceae bacterium]